MATEIIIPEVIPPSGTIVPNGEWRFVETSYEPHADVTKDEVTRLEDNDLLTGLKKQHKRTQADLNAWVVYYDAMLARFKEEQPRGEDGQFQPCGRPTLPQAFAAIGLKYQTERKRKQRYLAASNTRQRLPKPPSFEDGDRVKDADGVEFIVVGNPKPGEVARVPLGGNLDDAETAPADSLVRVRCKKLALGDLFLDSDNNKVYRYIGAGKLQEEDYNSALLRQKQDRDDAAFDAQQDKSRQAVQMQAEEKASADSKLRAEVAGRDRRFVAEKPAKGPKPKAARVQKPEKAKTKAQLEADKKIAEEKAKQAEQDCTMRAEIKAQNNAFFAQRGYNESNEYIGKQEVDEGE